MTIARRTHPGVTYEVGGVADLQPDSCLGVLAWYSMIHTPPDDVPALLATAHRALRPGGSLLLGFFDGGHDAAPEVFDHVVAPAWTWPVPVLTGLLAEAGFRVERSERRTDPGARPHAALEARTLRGRGPTPGAQPSASARSLSS